MIPSILSITVLLALDFLSLLQELLKSSSKGDTKIVMVKRRASSKSYDHLKIAMGKVDSPFRHYCLQRDVKCQILNLVRLENEAIY